MEITLSKELESLKSELYTTNPNLIIRTILSVWGDSNILSPTLIIGTNQLSQMLRVRCLSSNAYDTTIVSNSIQTYIGEQKLLTVLRLAKAFFL